MTDFTVSDLPTSINSVEKLVAWGNTVLNDLYPTQTVTESVNQVERVAQSALFFITASDPQGWRLISRTSIPFSSSWRRTGKLWVHAQDLGTSPIPPEYKS